MDAIHTQIKFTKVIFFSDNYEKTKRAQFFTLKTRNIDLETMRN
jgi:hypothetical protein